MKDLSKEFKSAFKQVVKDYNGKIGAFIILVGNDTATSTSLGAEGVGNLGKMISNSMKDQPFMKKAVGAAFYLDSNVIIASKPSDLDDIIPES